NFTGRWRPDEKRFVWVVIALVLLVTSIPYVYGYLSTPPDKQFMGIMLDEPDHAQYFSCMRELSTQNLASNKMTPEVNRPLFFNLLWWGLGRMGRLLGVDYAVMYQVLRVSAIILFLLVAYRLVRLFIRDDLARKTAFLLITFTSGFGWILVVIKYISGNELMFPLDVYIAEGNTFLGMLGYPHFIAAALYILSFELLLRGQEKNQLRYAVWAGLFTLFLGWQHAYDLVTVYAIWLAYALLVTLRDRKLPWYAIKSGLILGVISVWPALYSVVLTSLDPVWKAVLKQFANAGVYTPNLLHLPILFGFIFILAIIALVRMNPFKLKALDDRRLFLVGWFLINFALIYLPVDFQIHLLNGWQVPMIILAVMWLFDDLVPWAARLRLWAARINADTIRKIAAVGILVLVLPTNLYLWAWRYLDLSRHTYPYYLSKDELAGMGWLEKNARPDDVVFSSLDIGQYIPMMSGTHAYLAHWAQTLDFFTKTSNVDQFLAGRLDTAQQNRVLADGSVDYVFWGPVERASGYVPDLPTLKPVYTNPQVTIYQVESQP
nr:hypothetical protein [Anaerolinea sp.]